MSEIVENVFDGVEEVLDNFGLMTGDLAVPKRLGIGALVAGALMAFIKPSLSFDESGTALSWNVTNPEDPNATWFPWWFSMFIGAFIFGILI